MALQLCDQNVKTKQFALHHLLLLRCNTSFAHQYLLSPFLGQVVPATLTKTITSRNGDHSNSIYIFILYFLFFHVKGKTEAATRGALYLEIFQNSQENTCARVSFLIKLQAWARNFIKKETLVQALSCEFCEISWNTFFTEHLRATASDKIPREKVISFHDSLLKIPLILSILMQFSYVYAIYLL